VFVVGAAKRVSARLSRSGRRDQKEAGGVVRLSPTNEAGGAQGGSRSVIAARRARPAAAADIADADAVTASFEALARRHGRFDGLVCHAVDQRAQALLGYSGDEFRTSRSPRQPAAATSKLASVRDGS